MLDLTGPGTEAKMARRILAAVEADPSRTFPESAEVAMRDAQREARAAGWPEPTVHAVMVGFATVAADMAVSVLIAAGMVTA